MNWTKYENIQRPFFFSLLIIKGLQKKNQLLKRHTEKERKRERAGKDHDNSREPENP